MVDELSQIAGVTDGAAELLEAAGYIGVRDLARSHVDDVAGELSKANRMLRIVGEAPTRGEVERWVDEARRISGESPPPEPEEAHETPRRGRVMHKHVEEEDHEVNFEQDPVVAEMLVNAPLAIPVPADVMAEKRVPVGEVASGVLLTRVRGDIEIRVDTQPAKDAPNGSAAGPGEEGAAGLVKRGIDASKIKTVEQVRKDRSKQRVSSRRVRDERLEELRTASKAVNEGKDPNTRWFIRGLLYPHPARLRFAALVTLGCQLLVLPAVGSSVVLLLAVIDPEQFDWVSPWWLSLPMLLPVCALLFLIFAWDAKCRVCTQKMFLPRRCRRHPKAHFVPWLGYILPLCFHLLTFSWFRCTYCGTAARLKK